MPDINFRILQALQSPSIQSNPIQFVIIYTERIHHPYFRLRAKTGVFLQRWVKVWEIYL